MEEDHGICISKLYNYSRVINNCNKMIAISESIYNKFKKLYDYKKIELIYNGIKIDDFVILSKKKISDDINISIIGRVSEGKGQKEFIKAIEIINKKNISNVYARIIGDNKTEYAGTLIQYVNKNNIKNIEFINEASDIRKYYEMTDIVVVASRCEAFGRVAIESMLSNSLVIGANTGATIELVKNNETGLIYELGNAEDLATKIIYAINNKEKILEIEENAYNYAKEKFNSIKNAENIERIYKNL